jgi:tRNA modification GTPase
MEDTIAAISTPIGEGGIAIIRLSGPRAFDIADAMFFSPRGKPSQFPTHTIHFGTIGKNGDLIDQVMLTVMRAPRTYTAEDVVEINCHGGLLTAKKVLASCLSQGARLAQPGEFTKRAFLNGRIDLTQAEAVMDLISAKTDLAHAAAAHALEGHLARKIEVMRDRLITVVAHLEAHIDFPDEDIATDTREQLRGHVQGILRTLEDLIATAHEGKVLRDGIAVAIIGRPNAGKSSLMNVLLGHDRSIVTPVAGTTRDTIEETANIRGIPVRLTDTAGIRHARGHVERIGVERSRKSLLTSDLILQVIDASRAYSAADSELLAHCNGKSTLRVINKIDLPRKLKLPHNFLDVITAEVSTLTGKGIEKLKDLIEEQVWSGCASKNALDVVINERQADAIRRSINLLTDGTHAMSAGEPIEIISQQFRLGLDAIGEIVGKTSTEDLLDKIFSTFCIGK